MGRDKSKLRFEGRSLLGHVRAAAKELGCRVRIIRRDLVPRCGPLGGILTALKTSTAGVELFLACDMPFVSTSLLRRVAQSLGSHDKGAFIVANEVPGFPFALRFTALPIVEGQIHMKRFSIRALARALKAKKVPVTRGYARELININTPLEWNMARATRRPAAKRRASSKSDQMRRLPSISPPRQAAIS
jgi:molybdopterin-guanine dinucleotide biosynthesis protein A